MLNLINIQANLRDEDKKLKAQCDDEPELAPDEAQLIVLLAIHKRLGDLIMIGLRTG